MNDLTSQVSRLSADRRQLLERFLRQQDGTASSPIPLHHGGDVPLSFAQEQIWFLDRLDPGNPSYNIGLSLEIGGALDTLALEQALRAIIARHSIFRTTFVARGGQPVQVVAATATSNVPLVDLRHLPAMERRKESQRLAIEEARKPFDLACCPLLRLKLIRLNHEEHVLVIVAHHIIVDGWSMRLLIRELAQCYAAFSAGHQPALPGLKLQYPDFAAWQRGTERECVFEPQIDFWKARLAGASPALELTTDRARPATSSSHGGRHSFELPAELAQAVGVFARREECTPFMVILASFHAFLHRYTGQDDICVGSPVAGRNRPGLEGIVGLFVNTLVLRADLSGNPTFHDLLGQVRESCLGAYAHQDLPFERLVEELKPRRDSGRSPLFQALFAYDTDTVTHMKFGGLPVAISEIDNGTAKFDLSIYVHQRSDDVGGYLEHNSDLFDCETAARMLRHWLSLLGDALSGPDKPVSDLQLMGDDESQRILRDWNETRCAGPAQECLHRLVEAKVKRTPEAVALVWGTDRLTYQELNCRANRLAHRLRDQGVGPETLVGVCTDRSVEMIVALLAILKAGGAYVPLNPTYPAQHLGFILQDARLGIVVTQQQLAERLPPSTARLVVVDTESEYTSAHDDDLPGGADGRNLAYVLYTSGSTGQPKGVAVEHRGVSVFLGFLRRLLNAGELAGVLAGTSIGFDISVLELFGPLSAGGKVVLAEDPLALPSLPTRSEVTLVSTVPSAMEALLDTGQLPPSVETVILGGEALPLPLARRVYETGTVRRLYNFYGPTETTVYSTWALVPPHGTAVPSIGRPIDNTQVYVLDAAMHPAPVGVPGELFIGGDGVARGYLHRPELTAQKFMPDPFSSIPGAKLYRTGDRVRWLSNGELDFLGRTDHQIKLRGFRIEPAEVEAVLRRHPAVRQAVVVARESSAGEKRLVAYVEADRNSSLGLKESNRWLSERLPAHMVPSTFVMLDCLPLTPNGKIDRKALPAPESDVPPPALDEPPRTPVEEVVASVWADLLHVARVGIHANFFDLGGHSLLATRVVSRLQDAFRIDLPLRALFETPTVAELAERVEATLHEGTRPALEPVLPTSREGPLPLSFAQQRLWFLDQWRVGGPVYNVPAAVRLRGSLHKEALEQAVQTIVRRHEVLRTTFRSEHGQPSQVVSSETQLPLHATDLSDLPAEACEAELQRLMAEEARQPFDLARGPLLRVSLFHLSGTEHVLLLTMHHIVSDGWSLVVFLEELAALYGAFLENRPVPLPKLPVQYADFAVWQRDRLSGETLDRLLTYWNERLEGVACLALPTDRPRPAALSYRGSTVRFELPAEVVEAARGLSSREGCTLFMVLLAAFETLMHRHSGQDDFCVGTPMAGRGRPEIEGLIGFFANTLVLRADASGAPTFRELLARVGDCCLGAYAHQDLPFERLVEELRPERDPSRSPLFQVMFSLDHEHHRHVHLAGLEFSAIRVDTGTAKFDLNLSLSVGPQAVEGYLEYSTDLFEAATARRVVGHYRTLLEAACADPDQPVSRLPLLTAAEREELTRWNDTHVAFPEEHLLHRLIETQARRTPHAEALRFEERTLSYAELDCRATLLAHRLRALGVGPDVAVGVCMERSLELVVALLGVLKAGGAYVPLDPDYPAERLTFMLHDSAAPVLLTQSALAERLPVHDTPVLCLDAGWGADEEAVTSEPDIAPALTPEHLAYVIYTSGSTGQPKGAANTHRGICNRLLWMQQAYRLTPDDTVLQKTPFSFDVSVWEFFWPLLAGARLVLARPGGHKDPTYLAELIEREHVSICHFVPSMLQAFLQEPGLEDTCLSLRDVMCSGEALPYELQERFFSRLPARLHNLYGPTEAAVDVTAWECRRDDPRRLVPIGRPISNVRLHVLDPHLQEVPVGVPGELYIGGVALARGYHGRPELTAARFINHALLGRLYRTGDVGRRLADGTLDYLGRTDDQVKLRGFRIELGEVEAALRAHPAVGEAVVVARDDGPDDRRLVAYVVPDGQPQNSEDDNGIGDRKDDPVSQWRTVWEDNYSLSTTGPKATFDTTGWNSSYTGLPIAEAEMREWVDHTVERILALKPSRILEIGCGSGLLLSRVAPHCKQYTGIDFSHAAVRSLRQRLANAETVLPHVNVLQRAAHELDGIKAESLDTIVLNSVVQYFPSLEYLIQVLDRATQLVRPGGHIFLGDLRNFRLLCAFHASVQLHKAPATLTREQFRLRVENHASQERELLIDPSFFPELCGQFPRISAIDVQLKRGRHQNEMTRFRYDVVLRLGSRELPKASSEMRDWQNDSLDLLALRELLEKSQAPRLTAARVPNARLRSEIKTLGLLADPQGPVTAQDLREAVRQEDTSGVDPEELWTLGKLLGYDVAIHWSASGDDGCFDANFTRPLKAHVKAPSRNGSAHAPAKPLGPQWWRQFANDPMRGQALQRLPVRLREHLKAKLPEYMVPATFVLLEFLPLSASPSNMLIRSGSATGMWKRDLRLRRRFSWAAPSLDHAGVCDTERVSDDGQFPSRPWPRLSRSASERFSNAFRVSRSSCHRRSRGFPGSDNSPTPFRSRWLRRARSAGLPSPATLH